MQMVTQQMIAPTNDNENNDILICCIYTINNNDHNYNNLQMGKQQMTSPTNDNDDNLTIFWYFAIAQKRIAIIMRMKTRWLHNWWHHLPMGLGRPSPVVKKSQPSKVRQPALEFLTSSTSSAYTLFSNMCLTIHYIPLCST